MTGRVIETEKERDEFLSELAAERPEILRRVVQHCLRCQVEYAKTEQIEYMGQVRTRDWFPNCNKFFCSPECEEAFWFKIDLPPSL